MLLQRVKKAKANEKHVITPQMWWKIQIILSLLQIKSSSLLRIFIIQLLNAMKVESFDDHLLRWLR